MRPAAGILFAIVLAGCDRTSPGPAEDVPLHGAGAGETHAPAGFEEACLEGRQDGAASRLRPLRRPANVRNRAASDFLRDDRPLETATSGELDALVRSGDAFRDAEGAMAELGPDGGALVGVLAMHHAVHWAVGNRDRVRREQLPAIREAIASSPLLAELQSSDDATRQSFADRAELLTAIRSREYVTLLRGCRCPAALRRPGAADFERRYGMDLREGDVDRVTTPGARGPVESACGGQRIRLASSHAHSPVSRPIPVSALRHAPSDSGATGRRVSSGATVASATPRQP